MAFPAIFGLDEVFSAELREVFDLGAGRVLAPRFSGPFHVLAFLCRKAHTRDQRSGAGLLVGGDED
jgi:hypothetical protein